MRQQNIVSREYKIMVHPKMFTGSKNDLLAHAHALWDVATKFGRVARAAGDLSRIKTRRLPAFYDTPKRRLNNAYYILREWRAENGSRRAPALIAY